MKKFKLFIGIFIIAIIVPVVAAFISIPGYLIVSLVHWNFDITQWHWVGRLVFGLYAGYIFSTTLNSAIDKFKELDKEKTSKG